MKTESGLSRKYKINLKVKNGSVIDQSRAIIRSNRFRKK